MEPIDIMFLLLFVLIFAALLYHQRAQKKFNKELEEEIDLINNKKSRDNFEKGTVDATRFR